jgi:hypothetical protein
VGEKAEDFGAFNARAFASALVDGAADAGGVAREASVS